jgi:hypothetical protein
MKRTKTAKAMKGINIAMTLHHHPHSPLHKNLWCSSAESLLFLNSSVQTFVDTPFGAAA